MGNHQAIDPVKISAKQKSHKATDPEINHLEFVQLDLGKKKSREIINSYM